jgi:hypothetical protein
LNHKDTKAHCRHAGGDLIFLAALVLVVCLRGVAAAEPVLHEYVKPPKARSGRIVGGDPASTPRPEAPPDERRENPPAIRQDDKVLVEPQPTEAARPEEVRHGERGGAADRDAEARPDYLTQADGTLHYAEVFNPSIVPFKRMSSLDAVRDDYTLEVSDAKARPLAGAADTSADRDLFWGSLVLDLPSGGRPVPIPSVAPDMRVLSYETEPPVKLVFAKDAADNFSVRAADARQRGEHRLVFLVDAPASYFAPRVPRGVPLAQAAAARPAAKLPPRARRAAEIVLERLGVDRAGTVDAALDKLVEHFRSFDAGAPPSPSGDVYLDLALSRRGVCRHRAFAFVITASAAGIPARYVTNEAHAFAEVWLPEIGWVRVDLGGAALELEVANAGDKAMHRPRGADPFPKPREYTENYTRLRGPVDGLSREQIAEAQRPAAPATLSDDPSSTDPVTPATTDLVRTPETGPKKARVTLHVETTSRLGFRGEAVRVAGRAAAGDRGPAGLRVDLYLAPAGADGRGARIVGQTVTDERGRFEAAVELPLDLLLGRHEVYALTPGNAEYGPAISE